jgi:hypothetical protein
VSRQTTEASIEINIGLPGMARSWDAKGQKIDRLREWPYCRCAAIVVSGFTTRKSAIAAVRKALAAIVFSALVLLGGCSSLSTAQPSTERQTAFVSSSVQCEENCVRYDDAYIAWYALGMTFSGVTAAAGTSGVLSATLADEPNADIALAATAAGSGILTVVFNWLAGESAERYTECVARCRDTTFTTTVRGEP